MTAYVGPRNCRSFSISGITNMNAGFELWCDCCAFLRCPKRISGFLARLQDGFPLCHLKSVFFPGKAVGDISVSYFKLVGGCGSGGRLDYYITGRLVA